MEKEHPNEGRQDNNQILDDILRMATEEHGNFDEFPQSPPGYSASSHDYARLVLTLFDDYLYFRNGMDDSHTNNAESQLLNIFTKFAIAEPQILNVIDTESFRTFLQGFANFT
jgi:hypothetical protein